MGLAEIISVTDAIRKGGGGAGGARQKYRQFVRNPRAVEKTLQAGTRSMLEGLNVQPKCHFLFFIFRTPAYLSKAMKLGAMSQSTFDQSIGSPTAAVVSSGIVSSILSPIDVFMSKTYIQAVTVSHHGVEYEVAAGQKYPKGVIYPDNITMKFIDSHNGQVRRWLSEWELCVSFPDPERRGERIFCDEQEGAKRTGMLIINTLSNDIPNRFPRTMFYGLAISKIGDIDFSQDNPDYLTYDVEFSVDEVRVPLLY